MNAEWHPPEFYGQLIREQAATPPRPHRNRHRLPTFGEIMPAPMTWEQWQAARGAERDSAADDGEA